MRSGGVVGGDESGHAARQHTHNTLSPERSGKGQWAKRGGRGENREKGKGDVNGWIEGSHREGGEEGGEGRLERGRMGGEQTDSEVQQRSIQRSITAST
ncbi:hypothetical protein NQZ68_011440 [Dissostichus eleginoides]|nr:hypothetical protein NQZ68_011440 [Dissostichus eleginoides]